MVEEVNDCGDFSIVVTDELCDTGEYEIRVEDENGNILGSDTRSFDFYRNQSVMNRVRTFVKKCLRDNHYPLEEMDFDKSWNLIKQSWQETLREWEANIRDHGRPEPSEEKESDIERWNREELEQKAEDLLHDPMLLLRIDDVIHQRMASEHQNAMTNFIACASTLTDEPINLRWSGRSSVGKSAIATAVIRVFPREWTMVYIGMTGKSMYYDPKAEKVDSNTVKVDLDGKILLILEEDNAREFLEEAKPILAHDMEKHAYGYTDTSGSSPERKEIVLKGWPAYVGLSVNPERSVELGTREITAAPKMGQDKYGRVVNWKALRDFAPWVEPDEEELAVVRKALSMLDSKEVWIPYMPVLRRHFPTKKARSQRDWDKFVSAVKTVALLYQYQRDLLKVEGKEMVISEPFDALVATYVIESALKQAMSGFNKDQIEFHRHIAEESDRKEKTWWTYKELMSEYKERFGEKIQRATIQRRYVDEYVEAGVMTRDEESRTHEMAIASPIKSSGLFKLDKIREELRNLEMDGDYIENRFCTANEMVEANNPHKPEMEVDLVGNKAEIPYKDVISNLKYRLFEKDELNQVDWGLKRLEGPDSGKEESKEVPDFAEPKGNPNCEICKEEMGIEREAKETVDMNGREVWACEKCLREMGRE